MDVSKILVIEDSEEIVDAITIALKIRWPQSKTISTDRGEEGIELVEKENPDVVILDIGLPDINGFEVLKQIRLFSEVPVMILTVRRDESEIVKGLELGADEYVIKPFKQLELLSRIRAITRRHCHLDEDSSILIGDLYFSPSSRTISRAGESISLTRTECIILAKLLANKGKVVNHTSLAEEIWGNDYPDASSALKVYIRRLRNKIEPDPSHPRYILTKSGLGYLFSDTA